MKTIWQLIRATFIAWNADKAPRLAAALAFYTMFTLAPLLIREGLLPGTVAASPECGHWRHIDGASAFTPLPAIKATALFKRWIGLARR